MKAMNAVFWSAVAGIVICLAMTIYTGVKESQEKAQPVPLTIPTPAM
jgi:hypothetical protein